MIWIHTCLYNWITLDLCDIFRNCKTWIWYFFFLACCCCFHLTFFRNGTNRSDSQNLSWITSKSKLTFVTLIWGLEEFGISRFMRVWFLYKTRTDLTQSRDWCTCYDWSLVWKIKEPTRNVTLIGHSFSWLSPLCLTVASVSVCNLESETEFVGPLTGAVPMVQFRPH